MRIICHFGNITNLSRKKQYLYRNNPLLTMTLIDTYPPFESNLHSIYPFDIQMGRSPEIRSPSPQQPSIHPDSHILSSARCMPNMAYPCPSRTVLMRFVPCHSVSRYASRVNYPRLTCMWLLLLRQCISCVQLYMYVCTFPKMQINDCRLRLNRMLVILRIESVQFTSVFHQLSVP